MSKRPHAPPSERQTDPKDKAQGRYASHPSADQDKWQVLIKDHLPAYISWERAIRSLEPAA